MKKTFSSKISWSFLSRKERGSVQNTYFCTSTEGIRMLVIQEAQEVWIMARTQPVWRPLGRDEVGKNKNTMKI